jgi:hypothetical protein
LDTVAVLLFRISGAHLSDYLAKGLFAIFELNIESVVVSGFMQGSGLGSLAGGKLSNSRRTGPVKLFAGAEFLTGILGVFSLKLFHRIAEFTAGKSSWETGLVAFVGTVLSTLCRPPLFS